MQIQPTKASGKLDQIEQGEQQRVHYGIAHLSPIVAEKSGSESQIRPTLLGAYTRFRPGHRVLAADQRLLDPNEVNAQRTMSMNTASFSKSHLENQPIEGPFEWSRTLSLSLRKAFFHSTLFSDLSNAPRFAETSRCRWNQVHLGRFDEKIRISSAFNL